MDERTIESANASTQRFTDEATRRETDQVLTHAVFVKDKFEDSSKPLIIMSKSSQDRMDQMAEAGIVSHADDWASGHKNAQGGVSTCGPWAEGRMMVEAYLSKQR